MKHVTLEEITRLISRLDPYKQFTQALPPAASIWIVEQESPLPPPTEKKETILSDAGIVGFLFKESHAVVLPERVRPAVEWPADNPWVQTLIVRQEEGPRLCEGELSGEHKSCHPRCRNFRLGGNIPPHQSVGNTGCVGPIV